MNDQSSDPQAWSGRVLSEVAAAARLNEEQAGVLRVLRALSDGARHPTNEVARAARLPVPLAAAVLGELRDRELVDGLRPAGLTEQGRTLTQTLRLTPLVLSEEELLGGGRLAGLAEELDGLLDRWEVDLELDQAFATGATKVRRVVEMIRGGALPAPALIAIGDDDLISLAVLRAGRRLGVDLVGELIVVDVSDPVLDTIAAEIAAGDAARTTDEDAGFGSTTGDPGPRVELVKHDLREPLPEAVCGRATVAITDPPYTTQGAALFLDRALAGLRPGPGWDVFLHYGSKPPGPALDLQQALTERGLVIRSLDQRFSQYLGAGAIGSSSDAYRLEVAAVPDRAAPSIYDGPLYTADLRNRPREYSCVECGRVELVGKGREFPMIRDLSAAGCPQCGGHTFRPGRLRSEGVTP